MSAHRSLNKLERKAHMNIHNTVEVTGNEMDAKCFTRDRFGKRQALQKNDGQKNNMFMKRVLAAVFLMGLCFATPLAVAGETVGRSLSHKSTNVIISSSDLEPFSLNKKTESEEKRPTFYSDDKANIDINENGDPNLNMHF